MLARVYLFELLVSSVLCDSKEHKFNVLIILLREKKEKRKKKKYRLLGFRPKFVKWGLLPPIFIRVVTHYYYINKFLQSSYIYLVLYVLVACT